jgi:hypothetical protein
MPQTLDTVHQLTLKAHVSGAAFHSIGANVEPTQADYVQRHS